MAIFILLVIILPLTVLILSSSANTKKETTKLEHSVISLTLLNIEDHGSKVFINYSETYCDGSRKVHRKNVKNLSIPTSTLFSKTIVGVDCWDKVYCGILKNDVRILFVVRFQDGSAQLVQSCEGTGGCNKLLQLCDDTANGRIQPPTPTPETSAAPVQSHNPTPKIQATSTQAYKLGKNELPQGEYIIGQEIPDGTYDFFVIYGTGGKFDVGKYDANNDFSSEFVFEWVGLKEEYEKRELIHVRCKEGSIVRIRGNVILKIAKSQPVKIDL